MNIVLLIYMNGREPDVTSDIFLQDSISMNRGIYFLERNCRLTHLQREVSEHEKRIEQMEQHQPCKTNYMRAGSRHYPWSGNSAGNGNLYLGQPVRRGFEGRCPYLGFLPCYERVVPHGGRAEDEHEVHRHPLSVGEPDFCSVCSIGKLSLPNYADIV